MILRIWLKLFSIVLLAVMPLMAVQYLMQRESIELVLDMAQKNSATNFLDSHLANLKKLAQFDPEHSEIYRGDFEKVAEARNVVKDLQVIRRNLVDNILMQTLRNTLLVLIAALGATYLIARSIVAFLRRLISENERQSLRLERVNALESWQKVARMMVHEMRAPITPIKLIATDVESKFESLDRDAFRHYLGRGTELIRTQVSAIERLTENLTKFAKLPDVHKKPASISEFLDAFVETYRNYGGGKLDLKMNRTVAIDVDIEFDPGLLNLLLFNLLKNAVEANPDQNVEVRIGCRQTVNRTHISFANQGATIPETLAAEIFNPHVSTKNAGANFGVGLTIAKKIALDHSGDLFLAKSNSNDGVVFELELPNL